MSSAAKSLRLQSVKFSAGVWKALVKSAEAYLSQPIPMDSAVAAFQERKDLASLIGKLQKRSDKLKAQLESHFRSNQIQLIDGKSRLVRELVEITPTEVPAAYSYWRYSLESV